MIRLGQPHSKIAARLHVVGASGSGTTTLASRLAEQLGAPLFDADHYYWEPTDPPFTIKRPIEKRVQLLTGDLNKQSHWVLSGSLVNWGETIQDRFTYVIFLYLPQEIRLARLRNRERAKFGNRLDPGGDMYQQHLDFIEWAKRYDDGGLEVRSRLLHEHWFKSLTCPMIRVSAELSVEEEVQAVLHSLSNPQKNVRTGYLRKSISES